MTRESSLTWYGQYLVSGQDFSRYHRATTVPLTQMEEPEGLA